MLNLAADRVGMLGPDPRGVAFWQLPCYDALNVICRELAGASAPIRLVRAGVYAEIGSEGSVIGHGPRRSSAFPTVAALVARAVTAAGPGVPGAAACRAIASASVTAAP